MLQVMSDREVRSSCKRWFWREKSDFSCEN